MSHKERSRDGREVVKRSSYLAVDFVNYEGHSNEIGEKRFACLPTIRGAGTTNVHEQKNGKSFLDL